MNRGNSIEVDNQIEFLLKEVLRSPKYRFICEDIIKNIGKKELIKRKTVKEAIKATKNKLHQIAGAYFVQKPKYTIWLKKIKDVKESNEENIKQVCIEIMKFHSSVKERLEILEEFYREVFSQLPQINSILDLACGLNPLSISWMPISKKTKYYAYDIYEDLIDFLNSFIEVFNIPGQAEVRDILFNPPRISADLALILKTLPCLDQIDKSASRKLIEEINAKYVLVSFPVSSLGGRDKMMRKHYANRFNELIKEKKWEINRITFKTELVFLVKK